MVGDQKMCSRRNKCAAGPAAAIKVQSHFLADLATRPRCTPHRHCRLSSFAPGCQVQADAPGSRRPHQHGRRALVPDAARACFDRERRAIAPAWHGRHLLEVDAREPQQGQRRLDDSASCPERRPDRAAERPPEGSPLRLAHVLDASEGHDLRIFEPVAAPVHPPLIVRPDHP